MKLRARWGAAMFVAAACAPLIVTTWIGPNASNAAVPPLPSPFASPTPDPSGDPQPSPEPSPSQSQPTDHGLTCRATPDNTYYVAPSGADYAANGFDCADNSFASPWQTLRMSIRRLKPGDTLVMRAGTYIENAGYGAVPATASAPITIKPYEIPSSAQRERVVLKGTLQLYRADYWTIDGLNVTRNPDASCANTSCQFLVHFQGGTGWQLINSEVWGTAGVSNIMITGSERNGYPSRYRIAYDCIHTGGTADTLMNDHNIYLYPGLNSGPGMIERNIFWGATNGADIKAGSPRSDGGVGYVTIRYNTFVHSAAAVIVPYKSHHISMGRNLIGAQSGGSASYNGGIVGNHTSGIQNVASYDAFWGYAKSIRNTNDAPNPVKDGGHLAWVKPKFDGMSSCTALHPQDAASKAYGRYA